MMREDRGRREWQLIQLNRPDPLAANVRHGAIALDVPDDLPVLVGDRPVCRGLGVAPMAT